MTQGLITSAGGVQPKQTIQRRLHGSNEADT